MYLYNIIQLTLKDKLIFFLVLFRVVRSNKDPVKLESQIKKKNFFSLILHRQNMPVFCGLYLY